MADIFISYARSDQPRIEQLVAALEQQGFAVWWDNHLRSGAEFADDIEAALSDAQHVIVAWSADAAKSRWVRDEASEAAEQGKLIALSLDGTAPPMGFRQYHATDMSGWNGGDLPPALMEALGKDAPAAAAGTAKATRLKKPWFVAASAIALTLAGGTYIATQGLPGAEAEQAQNVSLAVMPFAYSGDEERAYLGPGIASSTSNGLAPLDGISLTSGMSTNALAAGGLTAAQLGEQLGVSHIVEGEVVASADGVRIDARLVETEDGRQIWSNQYQSDADGVEQQQQRLVRDIASVLQSRLGVGRGTLAQAAPADPRAYEAYLDGVEKLFNRIDANNRREALRRFNSAIAIDPDYADAHAGKAYLLAHSTPFQFGLSHASFIAEAREATRRALDLDKDNLLARAAQVRNILEYEGDIERATSLGKDLVEEAPRFGPAHYVLGYVELAAGNYDQASRHIEQAIARDPFNTVLVNARLANAHTAGNYNSVAEAIETCADCTGQVQLWFYAMLDLARPYELDQDIEALRERARRDKIPEPLIAISEALVRHIVKGEPYGGPRPEAFLGFAGAGLHAYLGYVDEAFAIAEQAARDTKDSQIINLLHDGRTAFPPQLRADPRYHALFDNAVAQRIVDYRRKKGIMAGLPLAPEEVATEKRRLAELRR